MFQKISAMLTAAEAVGIFAHENPDGDAMGSAYSLKLALLAMGKRAEVFLAPHPDAAALALIRGREEENLALADCDLFVAVDCAESARLGAYEEAFLAQYGGHRSPCYPQLLCQGDGGTGCFVLL